MAVKDFGTRKVRILWTGIAVSVTAVVGILCAMVFTGFDLLAFERANAIKPSPSALQHARYRPLAKAEWRIVRANLEARLKQRNPLELGAVWSTRTGQICGLVNGRGSFGGLTAMTRFYTVDQHPVFHRDVEHVAFQKAWFECRRDQYVMLHAGTMEPGFCGTELGKRRCFNVRNGVREQTASVILVSHPPRRASTRSWPERTVRLGKRHVQRSSGRRLAAVAGDRRPRPG